MENMVRDHTAMSKTAFTALNETTATERIDEIAEILAVGLTRLRARQSSRLSANGGVARSPAFPFAGDRACASPAYERAHSLGRKSNPTLAPCLSAKPPCLLFAARSTYFSVAIRTRLHDCRHARAKRSCNHGRDVATAHVFQDRVQHGFEFE